MKRDSIESIMNEVDDWNDYREFLINEFIDKYENGYMIVTYKIREALLHTHLLQNCKYIVLYVNYEQNEDIDEDIYSTLDSLEIGSYQYMNRINFIEHNGITITCGYNENSKKSFLENSIIYLNTEATKRKYKIRNLI